MPVIGSIGTNNPPGYVTPKNKICECPRGYDYILYLTPTASVIDMAINACKEEKRDQLDSRESQQMVKEALNQGYCDGSGESLNLSLIGE